MVATTNQKKCLALPARAVKFPDYSIGTLYVHECGTEMPRRPSWWNFASTPWHLGFPGMPVTDGTLAQLGGIPNLVELDLSGTQITDAGVKHLESFPRLQHLHLAGTQVTNRCLESITKFKCLRTLVVEGTGISKAGVAEIQNALPACEILPDEDW